MTEHHRFDAVYELAQNVARLTERVEQTMRSQEETRTDVRAIRDAIGDVASLKTDMATVKSEVRETNKALTAAADDVADMRRDLYGDKDTEHAGIMARLGAIESDWRTWRVWLVIGGGVLALLSSVGAALLIQWLGRIFMP